jgi:hypothetical protein
MFTRSKVKDFGVWKELFDSSAEFVKEHGVIASNVLRDLDDPNLVIVHHQFAEASAARTFFGMVNSDQFREGPPVKEGGVILETLEVWLGEDV